MSRRASLGLLGGIGAILVIVLLGEIWYGPAETAATVAAAEPAPPAQMPQSVQAAADQGDQSVDILLARPLFDPERKPEGAPGSAKAAAAAAGEPPRLAGIVLLPGIKTAIFQPAGKDEKPIVAGEGGDVAGWKVLSIDDGAVGVAGPHGTRTLSPQFDPNAAPSAVPPAGAPAKTVAAASPSAPPVQAATSSTDKRPARRTPPPPLHPTPPRRS